jgi:hypothetical protein
MVREKVTLKAVCMNFKFKAFVIDITNIRIWRENLNILSFIKLRSLFYFLESLNVFFSAGDDNYMCYISILLSSISVALT